ncbi:MAG: alkaline phosphatase family protein [Promethearchaeota archaeon]
MSSDHKKLLLIGVDQAIPYLLNKFREDDLLPNINKLLENGVYTEAYSCSPCDTPTNWTTIATGATTAIHGATSFYLHNPGEPFEQTFLLRSRTQLSRNCNAEYLWDVADKNGFTPYVINYPSGWPTNFRKGAMSVLIWPIPESLPRVLSYPRLFKFSQDSKDSSLAISMASNLINKVKSKSDTLEISIEINLSPNKKSSKKKVYVIDSNSKGYDSIAIIDDKNNYKEIKRNEWSDWIKLDLDTKHGLLPSLFKIKIEKIDPKGQFIHLKSSSIYNTKGWTTLDGLGEGLIRNAMDYDLTPKEQKIEYKFEGEVDQYLSYAQKEAITLEKAIIYGKKKLKWDFCFFHIHLLDSVNHKELAYLHEGSPLYSEGSTEKAEKNVKTAYKIIDNLVGSLMKSCVDKDTIVTFVSDHGALPAWKIANLSSYLMKEGLVSYKWNNNQNKYIIDWDKTYAFPYFEPPFIWVNLKGRDPNGIVPQSKFEATRDEIIEKLYEMRDPETGDKVIRLALRKEEAAYLGLDGDKIGDVVYFLNPPYEIYDEKFEHVNSSEVSRKQLKYPDVYDAKKCFGAHVYYLPTEKFGNFSNSVPLIMSGPGVKKNIKLKKPVNLVDLAPTLSDLLEIPKPRNTEGRVLYELFE